MNRLAITILVVSLVLCAGCSSQISQAGNMINPTPVQKQVVHTPTLSPTLKATTPIPTPAPEPVQVIATTIPTPVPRTAEPTPTPVQGYILPDKTPVPAKTPVPVDLTNKSTFNYTRYSDDDIVISYPESWTVVTGNVSTDEARAAKILYAVFKFKPYTRTVTFEGDEGVGFTATITDFTLPGTSDLDTRIEWAANTVTPRFHDVSGASHITNFEVRYTEFKTPYVSFDLTVPEGSIFYPYAYTERDLVSFNHFYTLRFNSEKGDLLKYKEVKDTMFKSLMTEERIKMDQWKEVRR